MKFLIKNFAVLIAVVGLLGGCSGKQAKTDAIVEEVAKQNSIYYWRTTFDVDSAELKFLNKHNINRIYLRMFDVAAELDFINRCNEVVPIATTKFVSSVPQGVEIVPVTYITIDALRAMGGREEKYASLIVERLQAISSYNKCGKISEMQLDCDWTATTKNSYSALCQAVKDTLNSRGMKLSVTIRLHQLKETPPPADKGVLMLYNTGALKKYDTKNSILDIKDVKPYMKKMKYPLPLDYAYPTYGWGIKFENRKFVSIVLEQDTAMSEGEHIRKERVSVDEILAVKQLVESNLGKPSGGNILYHLDDNQLKNYSDNEISKIFAY